MGDDGGKAGRTYGGLHLGNTRRTNVTFPKCRTRTGPRRVATWVPERVEPRLLLSGTGHQGTAAPAAAAVPVLHAVADPHYTTPAATATPDAGSTYAGSSTPYGKNPTQIRSAYGLGDYGSDTVTFDGVEGDGQGQTIAIIDAYDDPTALSDLNAFSTSQYFPTKLPTLTSNASLSTLNSAAGPTFTKVGQTGSTTSLPGFDPSGPYSTTGGSDFEQEESLDIEWAHVMAPLANIVLVECMSPSNANLFTAGVALARATAGVDVVSMSFGGDETSNETTYDTDFTTPSGHVGGSATAGGTELAGGVTFLASAGDSGAFGPDSKTVFPQYPAASPDVVAVGGTTLNTNGTTYVSESAWGNGSSSGTEGGGGGGISKYETQPSYQASTVAAFSTTKRTYPDLSIEADPDTGVPIYDSYDFGASTPWIPGYEGGTSLACPMTAGLVALADQDRALNGLGSLDGRTGTLPNIYSISGNDYHDITTGNNGYAAGTGYDLASGRGSPIANLWVADIAAVPANVTAVVTGRVFQDDNADGTPDGADAGLANQTVYLDLNNDGVHESSEPTATTNASGAFTFSGLAAGTGTVRLLTSPAGYVPVAAATYTVTAGGSATANVALFPTAYTDANANDAYTVRTSPSASATLQVLVDGAVTYTAPTSLVASSALSFTFTGSADSIAVDFGNGDPVPSGGLSVNGTAAGNGDSLAVLGTTGNDTISVAAGTVTFGSNTITYASVPNLSVDPRTGTDSLTVTGVAVTLPAQAAGGGLLARTFSTLAVGAGGKVAVASPAARADRTVLVVTTAANLTLASTGTLDLGGNDLIVRGGNLATVTGLAATGYAAGAWTGAGGLTSSAAAADASHLTALGVIAAGTSATPASFDGLAVASTDVLVKYTYYGDANFDGLVNAADYLRTDVGFFTGVTGWANGDYNYDGTVDGSDYTLIDNAYNTEGSAL